MCSCFHGSGCRIASRITGRVTGPGQEATTESYGFLLFTLQSAESEAAGVFILSFAATTVYCGRREAWKSQDVFAMSSGSGGFTAQDGPAAVSPPSCLISLWEKTERYPSLSLCMWWGAVSVEAKCKSKHIIRSLEEPSTE